MHIKIANVKALQTRSQWPLLLHGRAMLARASARAYTLNRSLETSLGRSRGSSIVRSARTRVRPPANSPEDPEACITRARTQERSLLLLLLSSSSCALPDKQASKFGCCIGRQEGSFFHHYQQTRNLPPTLVKLIVDFNARRRLMKRHDSLIRPV